MRRFLLQAVAVAGIAVFAAAAARAEISEVEILFVKADTNGDLVLSKAEYLIVAITQFGMTDGNRNNAIEKQEVGDLSADAEYSDNDIDKDGALSIEEVIQEKLADFASADIDKDGSLSLDEVKAQYERTQ